MSKPVPLRLRLFGWWPTRAEFRVLLFDLRQRLSGRCNDCPWLPDARMNEYRGGYSHWRCGLPRGHETLHRFRNYTWGETASEQVTYDPVPGRLSIPFAVHPDAPGYSFRQRRASLALHSSPKSGEVDL